MKAKLVGHNADRSEFQIEPGTVDPREVCVALDKVIPPEIGLMSGSGMTAGFVSLLMTQRRSLVQAGHFFGCIGQMLPAAMGAVAATGNKPLVLIDGDASVMMHLAEFETAVRYNMPLLVIVMNNEALGAEYYKLDAHKMDVKYFDDHDTGPGRRRGRHGRARPAGEERRRSVRRHQGVGGEAGPDDDRPAHLPRRAEHSLPAHPLRSGRVDDGPAAVSRRLHGPAHAQVLHGNRGEAPGA